MKANELMIGDWVEFHCGYGKVTGITDAGLLHFEDRFGSGIASGAEPIPLTPEILEKNGWECFDTYGKYIHYRHPKVPFDILQRKDGGYTIEVDVVKGGAVFLFILYVHQLQHAIRLCGIEKEIELY